MTPKDIAKLIPLGPEHQTWLEDIRRELFNRALVASYGNQSKADQILGVHRQTLRNAIEHFPGKKP